MQLVCGDLQCSGTPGLTNYNNGIKKLAPYFYPHQLGVGSAGGCEAAVHSARRYIEAMPRDHVLVKLDFQTHSTGFTEMICSTLCTTGSQNSTRSVSQLTVSRPFYTLGLTPFCPRKAPSKAIRSDPYCSATLYTRRCHLCKPN